MHTRKKEKILRVVNNEIACLINEYALNIIVKKKKKKKCVKKLLDSKKPIKGFMRRAAFNNHVNIAKKAHSIVH